MTRLDETEEAPPLGSRRTQLANERTFLAWWRTGLTALAVSLGVGRIVPELTDGQVWPYVTLGAGYAVLGIAMIAYAGRRQQEVEAALAKGEPATIDGTVLRWLTALGIGLALATLVVVLAQP